MVVTSKLAFAKPSGTLKRIAVAYSGVQYTRASSLNSKLASRFVPFPLKWRAGRHGQRYRLAATTLEPVTGIGYLGECRLNLLPVSGGRIRRLYLSHLSDEQRHAQPLLQFLDLLAYRTGGHA